MRKKWDCRIEKVLIFQEVEDLFLCTELSLIILYIKIFINHLSSDYQPKAGNRKMKDL
jgi:hypothetical protein